MREYIITRVLASAEYILEHNCTVREVAKIFDISKSTVHKDVSERLNEIDKDLCKRIKKVLETNLQERHIRGGIATKNKYEKISRNRV